LPAAVNAVCAVAQPLQRPVVVVSVTSETVSQHFSRADE